MADYEAAQKIKDDSEPELKLTRAEKDQTAQGRPRPLGSRHGPGAGQHQACL
jgi:hypothetical protein